jgi:hypothetical protein
MSAPPEVAVGPTPGKFYRIRYGDTLLGVAGQAFGVAAGEARLERARWINRSRYNDRFRGEPTSLFPEGLVSFNPRFAEDALIQASADGRCPSGHAYAILWIPEHEGQEPDFSDEFGPAPDEGEMGLSGLEDEPEPPGQIDDTEEPEHLPLADEEHATLVAPICRNLWNTIDSRPNGFGWFSA